MENTNTILIDEKEREDARALTQSFARADVKSRAYINALGAEVCLKYFRQENISDEPTYNLHNIRKILEEFDISDVMLSNIHIDVRVIFDENQIFIPKSHFEYNLLPDIYVVLKLAKDHQNTEFLGFFEPKLINKNNTNGDYYFIEKEKLSSPVDLKNYVNNFKGNSDIELSETDTNDAEFLIVSMTDNNITEEDKKKLINYLTQSARLRDSFIEFENFEMLSYQASNIVGLEPPVKEADMDIADIPSEEISNDIAEEVLDEASVAQLDEDITAPTDSTDSSNNISDNILGDAVAGAAVLGAEIAGSAMASAALTGAAETVDTTSNIVNAAANVANITEDAIDMAQSIQNMAEQVFSDSDNNEKAQEETTPTQDTVELPSKNEPQKEDNIETTTEPEQNNNENNVEEVAEENISDNTNNIVEEPTEASNDDNMWGDLNSNLNELFGDDGLGEITNSNSDNDEITFETNNNFSGSDDLVFENNSDDEITFSNNDVDYGDDLVFENYSDDNDSSMQSNSRRSTTPHGMHTPITEATELTSLEDIKNNNFPKATMPHITTGDEMETMEMDEFHALVKNYVPPEIKDESETIAFDNLGASSAIKTENATEEHVENPEELGTLPDSVPKPEKKDDSVHESDAYVEEMPEEKADQQPVAQDELTSDDFVEDLPDMSNLAAAMDNNELTSDDFVEDMPDMTNLATSMDNTELTSDDFVEDMPDMSNLAAAMDNAELTSDDFVEDMPEIQETAIKEETQETSINNASNDNVEEINNIQSENNEPVETKEELPQETSNEIPAEPIAQDETTAPIDSETNMADQVPEVINASDSDILSDASILEQLDALGLGELDSSDDTLEPLEQPQHTVQDAQPAFTAQAQEPLVNNTPAPAIDSVPDIQITEDVPDIDITEETPEISDEIPEAPQDNNLQVLYNGDNVPELDTTEIQPDEEYANEDYDFKPEKKTSKLMPIFAVLAAIIVAGSVIGFLNKNGHSIDANETLIQTTPENETVASPEVDNSDILANSADTGSGVVPQDAADISPTAPAQVPAQAKQDKPQAKAQEKPAPAKPINSSKTITLKKVSWQVPDYLSYSENINKYLQTAGKSIKLTLSSDLLLTNEYIYSNQVKVSLKLSKDGTVQNAQISKSSGSTQVDNIVLRTVKDTLSVVKPAQGEVPTPSYNLTLIINL